MNRSESIADLAKSLAAFQKEVKQPPKNGYNPHFKSEYVTLDDTIKVINETAPKHGLSYIQTPISNENGVGVITIIMHESGQYIEFPPLILPLDKHTAQGAGSAITYARRYSISAAFGLVSDSDDDANSVSPMTPQQIGQAKVQQLKQQQQQKQSQPVQTSTFALQKQLFQLREELNWTWDDLNSFASDLLNRKITFIKNDVTNTEDLQLLIDNMNKTKDQFEGQGTEVQFDESLPF